MEGEVTAEVVALLFAVDIATAVEFSLSITEEVVSRP